MGEAFFMMMNGNETKNYLISIEFAKKLAMQAKTEVGERIRDYFLECERKVSQPVVTLPDFNNPVEAARAFDKQKNIRVGFQIRPFPKLREGS